MSSNLKNSKTNQRINLAFMKQTTAYLLLICLVSAMGGLLFGYDWVVIGGAKIFYEPFFQLENSAALRGWAMSSSLIGCRSLVIR